jgi:Ca2+-binding RTX toxin-like protein
MIKAQAFREQRRQPQPSREDYVFDDKPRGNFAPLAFLTILAGFAVYLKSFLSVAREAPPQQRGKGDDAASTETLHNEDPVKTSPEEAAESEAAGSLEGEPQTSPRRGASREWADEFVLGSVPARTNSQSYGADGALGSSAAANDNQGAIKPLAYEAADTIRTGVGGGGGGQDDALPIAQRQKEPDDVAGPPPVDGPRPRDDDSPQDRNRLPRTNGPVVLPDLIACQAYFIPVLALLAGASDPDGDPLKVLALTSTSGRLTPVDGGWMFTADRGDLRDVVFRYAISDGTGYVQQVAQLRVVEAPPIVGTDGDDNMLGTTCGDVIDARAGDDNIDSRQGNDVIVAGNGGDHIVAGEGHDIVFAGTGADIIFAGSGNDIVYGGTGNDRMFGEAGNDTLMGEDGDDLIVGGEGHDILLAGSGNDTVQGDAGHDTLDGGAGNDALDGGDGADKIFAGDGDDVVSGGAGDDIVLAGPGDDMVYADTGNDIVEGGDGDDRVSGGAGDDILADGHGSDTIDGDDGDDFVIAAPDKRPDEYDGGRGEDTLDYSSAVLDIFVDVGQGTAEGADIGRDFIASFEKVIGGQGDDHFVGNAGPISMTGGDGEDTFEFQRSDDDHQPDLVRKITDFTFGDRIIAARYEIYYRTDDGEAGAEDEGIDDLFDDIYLSENNDSRPIRFRFEEVDDGDCTFVEIHDRDDSEDYYSIQLSGRHDLEFTVVVS